MAPAVELHEVITIVSWIFWLLMFCVAVFSLVKVTHYFTGESPQTMFAAIRATLIVCATVYFTYDFSGYLFALMMQDPENGIRMPANYSYLIWMREPFALKWYVLGFVPIIRYLPILFAFLIGCIAQVLLFDIPYHISLVVFAAQLVINLLALIVLSFVFNLGIAMYEQNVIAPKLQQRSGGIQAPEKPQGTPPDNLNQLKDRISNLQPGQGPFLRRVEAEWAKVNGNLKPLYDLLQPLTCHLPLPAQDFLEGGGWLIVLPGLAGLIMSWPRIHHGRRRLHHRRRKPQPFTHTRVQLADVGDSMTGFGEKQVSVRGHLGRLRLVILAPPNLKIQTPPAELEKACLNAALHGLGEIHTFDFPKVEYWNDPQAHNNFRSTVIEGVQMPEAAGQPSRWVLLIGQVTVPQGLFHMGLAILTEKVTNLRFIEVGKGQWGKFLGIHEVPIEKREL